MKRLQEVFAVGIGQTWIVEIYFGNPGYTAQKYILEAGCVAAVIEIVSPSQPRPAVIHRTSISGKGGVSRPVGWVIIQPVPVLDPCRGRFARNCDKCHCR